MLRNFRKICGAVEQKKERKVVLRCNQSLGQAKEEGGEEVASGGASSMNHC
jgi:hypothetical protein